MKYYFLFKINKMNLPEDMIQEIFSHLDPLVYKDVSRKYYQQAKKKLTKVVKTSKETSHYYRGVLHRDDDKPAVIWSNGTRMWYQCGKLHRNGYKPAIIFSDGTKIWYRYGKLNRNGYKPVIMGRAKMIIR